MEPSARGADLPLTYVVPLVVSLFLFHGVVRQALRQVAGGARG
jgi:hypothetical protein